MSKAAERAAKKAAAEKEFQAKLVEQFAEKTQKAKACKDAHLMLQEWLQNPPYKCTDEQLQVRSTGV